MKKNNYRQRVGFFVCIIILICAAIYQKQEVNAATSYATEYDGLPAEIRENCVKFARYKVPSLPAVSLLSLEDKKKIINNYTPKVGAIAITKGNSSYGHVAYVEAVNGSQITTLNGGWENGVHIGRYTATASAQGIIGYWYPANLLGNTPQGYLETSNVYGGGGTVHVKGWAFDRDNVNAQLSIHVYIGGPAGTSGAERHIITANKLRTDVNAAFSNGVGNYHGFEDTIKTKKSGKQDIYVYAINIGTGNTNPELGHKAVTITPVNNPQGDLNINSVYGGKGTIHVRGWAFDKDNVNTHLTIHVYIGGPAGTPGAERHIITANKQRTDVPDVYPGVGNYHGYEETIVTKKSGSQGIYVYAMNIGSGNDNPLLGKKTVAIEPVYKPQGWLETSNVRGGKKTVTLRGWAFDKDELNTQLNIRVYIGGDENSKAEKHIIKANKKRIDVYNKFPETGYYHGFEETIKVNSLGKQRIYVYADNVGRGTENLFLGSKEVTILDDVRSNPNVPKYKPMYIPSSSIKEIKKLKKVRGLSVKAKKRKITIKWKQVPNANGYQVQYATNKKFRQKKAKIAKKAKITLNKIKTRKIYYVKVRAYVRNGKDIVYGKWSKTKKKKLSN